MADESYGSQSADRSEASTSAETEILLTRLVDGEASADEHRTFTARADRHPSLWRVLAERQLEMTLLSRAAWSELDRASHVELPDRTPGDIAASHDVQPRARLVAQSRAIAWMGWAVAAMLLLWVGVLSFAPEQHSNDHSAPQPAHAEFDQDEVASAHQWLRLYLDAPYVVGELDPILLETRELDDGRVELRFIRRIEEILRLQSMDDLPIDEHGRLKIDAERVRQGSDRGG